MALPPIKPTVAPNLPAALQSYDAQNFELLNNALRLYFNQLDSATQNLFNNTGGAYLGLPHIGASDTTDQYADGDDTPTIVKWNTLESSNGFTLNANNTATVLVSGIYKIDYSLQIANTANAVHDVTVWLKIDGNDIANSATKFSIPARKSAGVPAYLVAYSTVVFPIEKGQSVALWWATELAYNPVGPVDGVYFEHLVAQTSPYAHPAVPSVIGAITFVSRINT